jgi:hypothetical protein
MNSILEKRVYTRPQLECVNLDSEISLVLQSPPPGPDESIKFGANAPEIFQQRSF